MPLGVRIDNGKLRGVDLDIKGKALHVQNSIEGCAEDLRQKAAVVGLPLKDFFIKSIILPQLPKKELSGAVKLQVSSNLPFEESEAHVGYRLKKLQKGYGLLIAATKKRDIYKPRAILPEPLALYSLAMRQDLLDPGKNSLVVHMEGDGVITLAVEGHEVVFMRSFRKDTDLASELRLSAQAVYLKEERSLLEIDRVILFGSGLSREEIRSIFSSGDGPPEVVSSDIDIREGLLVPTGLALSGTMLKKLPNPAAPSRPALRVRKIATSKKKL